MNFSTDRDLLALDPFVFADVPFTSQCRLQLTDAAVAGPTLTSAAADFVAAQVEPGSVMLIGDTPVEVLERLDLHTLTVSLLRHRLTAPAIPPAPGSGLTVTGRTFAPQATLVHDELVALLGLESDDPIVSLSVMARLEALGTLDHVYSAAVALTGDEALLLQKANDFRRRFRQSIARATILLDLDDDGVADTRRCLGVVELIRV